MTTQTEVAWAAGFFEGEGTIRINAFAPRNLGIAHASVVSTEPCYIELFQRLWPGYLGRTAARGRSRMAHRWNIGARKVAAFMNDIEPYVVGDRMRARISVARDFIELKASSRGNCKLNYEYHQQSFELYLLMRELNLRGPVGPAPHVIAMVLETEPSRAAHRARDAAERTRQAVLFEAPR